MLLSVQLLAVALASAPPAMPAEPAGAASSEVTSAVAIPEVVTINGTLTGQLLARRDDVALESGSLGRATLEVPAWQRTRDRSRILEVTSVGVLLVGGVTWAIGQIQLDALKTVPPGPDRDAKEGLAYTLNVGGVGFLVAGAAIWLIAAEVANWPPDLPVSAAVTGTDGGANLSVGLRFP